MDEKTQRYLQRIDKIMLTPGRKGNQARPSKSPLTCRTNNLDKYIKYELSTKIIQNIISKHHTHLVNVFFNAIRNTEFRQKEKIYKFIAIEKNAKQIRVDTAISAKILFSALKELTRRRYTNFVNSLLEFSQPSNSQLPTNRKPKLDRQRSSKESSTSYGVLMRTSTIPERQNYRMVSEWIDDSSALEEKQNASKKEDDKTKKIVSMAIAKLIQIKIRTTYVAGFYKIQTFISNSTNESKEIPPIAEIPIAKQPTQQPEQHQTAKISRRMLSIYGLSRFGHKFLNSILAAIKNHNNRRIIIKANATILSTIVDTIIKKQQILAYHRFFTILSLRPIKPKYTKSQVLQVDSKRPSSQVRSQSSQVQPYNPLIKLNFYSFVDKIFKLILILSKLLIPIREAFIKIDQYASFSYRLEESLKVAPNRLLLQSFTQIKLASATSRRQLVQSHHEDKRGEKFNEIIMSRVMQRLIDGFILIKIRAESKQLKIKIFPVRENIIEKTRQFIQDREEHKSHSYDNWNQLKSILTSPKDKARMLPKTPII